MGKKLKASLDISRPSRGDDKEYVEIRIRDEISGVRFVTLEIDLETFARALTGLSGQEVDMEVTGLEFVGKVKEREAARVPIPKQLGYNRKGAEEYVKANFQREGWILDPYLGSQQSITGTLDDCYANIHYYRYVEPA